MSPKSKLLEGYLSEQEMAAEIKRSARTLQRYRKLQVGPRYVLIGLQPFYRIEDAREWLAAGGTVAAPNPGRRARLRAKPAQPPQLRCRARKAAAT